MLCKAHTAVRSRHRAPAAPRSPSLPAVPRSPSRCPPGPSPAARTGAWLRRPGGKWPLRRSVARLNTRPTQRVALPAAVRRTGGVKLCTPLSRDGGAGAGARARAVRDRDPPRPEGPPVTPTLPPGPPAPPRSAQPPPGGSHTRPLPLLPSRGAAAPRRDPPRCLYLSILPAPSFPSAPAPPRPASPPLLRYPNRIPSAPPIPSILPLQIPAAPPIPPCP